MTEVLDVGCLLHKLALISASSSFVPSPLQVWCLKAVPNGGGIFHAVSNLLIVMMQKAPGQLAASAPLSVLGSAPAGTSWCLEQISCPACPALPWQLASLEKLLPRTGFFA